MIKRISMRARLTILCIALLTACCVGLTLILNLSANRMADTIEALPVVPSYQIGEDGVNLGQVAIPVAPATLSPASKAARNIFLTQSIVLVIVVLVLGGVLTYYISSKSLRPLSELSRQMKNRTVHNLSEKLTVPQSKDEIATLTLSFNEMSAKLDDAFAIQKRFSQSAAHELRTPLTVIRTKLEVFAKTPSHTNDEYEQLLSSVAGQTERLSGLVQSLLKLSSMDTLECDERVILKPLLEQIATELSPIASNRDIHLTVSGIDAVATGNSELLYQAFYNLLENAVKYNNDGGYISVTISDGVIAIADSGIGIAADQRELIFEPFYRIDKSRSRKMGGAGLGLSTVKAIFDKHNWTIKIEDNKTVGSIFLILIQ